MSIRAAATAELNGQLLAIRETTLDGMVRALWEPGEAPQPAVQPSAINRRSNRTPSGRMAVIPFTGSIWYRSTSLLDFFFGTSLLASDRALDDADQDSAVETIILDFDTGGGGVAGVPEFAARVRDVRQRKPVVALINTTCCSAGYWIASQASTIVATPSGETGSVGVRMVHYDASGMNAELGIKPTHIATPRSKVAGTEDEPLNDDTRKYLQQQVDRVYADFVNDVARGRGISVETVKKHFGQGLVVDAREALRKRMIDQIVATPTEAFGFAATYASKHDAMRRQADRDYTEYGIRIAERL
jgi:capsid assembly protease